MTLPALVADVLLAQPTCLNCLAEKANADLHQVAEAVVAIRSSLSVTSENVRCPACRRSKIVFSAER